MNEPKDRKTKNARPEQSGRALSNTERRALLEDEREARQHTNRMKKRGETR